MPSGARFTQQELIRGSAMIRNQYVRGAAYQMATGGGAWSVGSRNYFEARQQAARTQAGANKKPKHNFAPLDGL